MLGVVFLVVPGAFGFMIWRSYRNAGEGYQPEGRRWDDVGSEDRG